MEDGVDNSTDLKRIADALERISPPPPKQTDWRNFPAYVWEGTHARELEEIEAPDMARFRGVERQSRQILENTSRLAWGNASHDMLLWGARGMGKSALVKAATKAIQAEAPMALALVQVAPDALDTLPELFNRLAGVKRFFLIFVDDLGFSEDDTIGPRKLRSWLEGGVEARPVNCRLAVTSNRRAILARQAKEQDTGSDEGGLNRRDAVDDKLALADRFGLAIGFHPCGKDQYLAIVAAYAEPLKLEFSDEEALEWAMQRGQRSGRSAWQFVVELAGRAGKQI
jgi:predicted AAA+ superfamily ATPase